MISESFNPNVRQALAKFKPNEAPAAVARDLSGSAFALVRGAPEPVATITLDPKKTVTVTAQGMAVQTSSTDHSALLSASQLDMIAIRGRDVVSMLRILPGVSTGVVVGWGDLPINRPSCRRGSRATARTTIARPASSSINR